MSRGSVTLTLPDIAQRLKRAELPEVDVVVGIATGGIVPASLVAYRLELPLRIMHFNFRAADNSPQRPEPTLLQPFGLEPDFQNVLLVDDVSVTGATFSAAMGILENRHVTTFALKGKADIVLYPEVASCIYLPWRDWERPEKKGKAKGERES